ncbi:MAG: phage terminase large subunit [Xanthobacteraceae bacterium]
MENDDSSSRASVSRSIVSKLDLTPRQRDAQALLQSGKRHVLLVGGARSGKTTVIVNEIVERALKAGGSRHVILRHRANAVRPSIALDTLPKVFKLGFPGRALKAHRTDGYFSLGEDSEIWFGGLDEAERVEKILGKEYATIFFNECSQISYASVLIALTRLAQVVKDAPQRAFYDLNPTNKGHWSNVLFGDCRDPVSRAPLDDPEEYARLFLSPRDNPHLTDNYLKSLQRLPERQRKRFYEGVYIDDLDGALFTYEIIARGRVAELPTARRTRVVVAVDPSGAAGRDDEAADEIGIIVAARGDDNHAYVLADRSLRDGPGAWARAVVQAAAEFGAERIIAEENFGGAMVRAVIVAAGAGVTVQMVSASRGKVLRAEPVSALYEQGLVHHVGRFAMLEDQLCAFTTSGYRGADSPDHADALVFAISELMLDEPDAVLEYYRRRAEAARRQQAEVAPVLSAAPAMQPTLDEPAKPDLVMLRPPSAVSCVHGSSTTLYMAAADGSFAVSPEDAKALFGHGFVRMDEGGTDDPLQIKPPVCGAPDAGSPA